MIPSLMILTGYALILSLAYYWMRRAVKAELRLAKLRYDVIDVAAYYERLRQQESIIRCSERASLRDYACRLSRIIEQETPGANATVKRIIRIARGE